MATHKQSHTESTQSYKDKVLNGTKQSGLSIVNNITPEKLLAILMEIDTSDHLSVRKFCNYCEGFLFHSTQNSHVSIIAAQESLPYLLAQFDQINLAQVKQIHNIINGLNEGYIAGNNAVEHLDFIGENVNLKATINQISSAMNITYLQTIQGKAIQVLDMMENYLNLTINREQFIQDKLSEDDLSALEKFTTTKELIYKRLTPLRQHMARMDGMDTTITATIIRDCKLALLECAEFIKELNHQYPHIYFWLNNQAVQLNHFQEQLSEFNTVLQNGDYDSKANYRPPMTVQQLINLINTTNLKQVNNAQILYKHINNFVLQASKDFLNVHSKSIQLFPEYLRSLLVDHINDDAKQKLNIIIEKFKSSHLAGHNRQSHDQFTKDNPNIFSQLSQFNKAANWAMQQQQYQLTIDKFDLILDGLETAAQQLPEQFEGMPSVFSEKAIICSTHDHISNLRDKFFQKVKMETVTEQDLQQVQDDCYSILSVQDGKLKCKSPTRAFFEDLLTIVATPLNALKRFVNGEPDVLSLRSSRITLGKSKPRMQLVKSLKQVDSFTDDYQQQHAKQQQQPIRSADDTHDIEQDIRHSFNGSATY